MTDRLNSKPANMYFLESVSGKNNSFWRYLLTSVAAWLAAGIIGCIPLIIVLIDRSVNAGVDLTKLNEVLKNPSIVGISQNLFLFLFLITFAVGLFTLILLIKWIHKRSFAETVNGTKRVRWDRVFTGFGVSFLLSFVFLMLSLFTEPENYTFQFDIKTFIPLFFITLIFIPLQASFEELFCRGYLAQGIGAWTKNRWLAVFIPSILFGLLHGLNTEVETYGFFTAMPYFILSGVLFGLISVLDDGIELAMGLHAADNIFGCLFVSYESSSLPTPAIFHQQSENIPQMYIGFLLYSLIVFIYFSKKYKWNFAVMNKKVEVGEVCNDHHQKIEDHSEKKKVFQNRVFFWICCGIIIFSVLMILIFRNNPEKNDTVNLQVDSSITDLSPIPVYINDSVYHFALDSVAIGNEIVSVCAQKIRLNADGSVLFENITVNSGETRSEVFIKSLKITDISAKNGNEEEFLDDVEIFKQSLAAILKNIKRSTGNLNIDSACYSIRNGSTEIKMTHLSVFISPQ